jgi:uncharacterized tellurite resistance protein B-like protein
MRLVRACTLSLRRNRHICCGTGAGAFGKGTAMLNDLKALLLGRKFSEPVGQEEPVDPLQLSQAALMFHVIAADGLVTDTERSRLREILRGKFGLDDKSSGELIEKARAADNEAVDLYAFTRTLKRDLDEQAKAEIIEDLWEMVYADGSLNELEDNIVWRVAELLGVESRTRMELKRAVRDSSGQS